MTDEEAIDRSNNFTEIQEGYFNIACNNKMHTIKTNGRITTAEIDEDNDVAAHYNSMTQTNIDANISPNLGESGKLSDRPC